MSGPAGLLNQVVPFHLVWNLSGELATVSPALRKLWSIGPDYLSRSTIIRLHRPFEGDLDPSWLPELTGLSLHLSVEKCAGAVVKGQIIQSEDLWIFVGGPLVSSVRELEEMGLKLTDLPIHDTSGDMLIAIEANRVSLAESQRHARELSKAVSDLQTLNRSLSGFVPDPVLDTLGLDRGAEGSVQFSTEAVGLFIQRLQQALEFRESFLANMSHELRTPLNAILGISEALQEGVYGDLTPKQLEMIGTVTSSGDHLLSLINDILNLSKIEAGEAVLRLQDCNLEKLCSAALRFSLPREPKPDVAYRFEYRSKVQTIRVDQRRIRQVLLNLLSNAAKFTDAGEIVLTVDDLPDENSIVIRVQDSGIGIPSNHLDRLFDAFYQVDHGISRAHQGTGLGLAITQRVVQHHGGRIELTSEVGRGSTFSVILPREATESRVPSTLEELTREIVTEPGSLEMDHELGPTGLTANDLCPVEWTGKRVLVMDAEPLNRVHLVDHLGKLGFEVEEAGDGLEALEIIQRNPPSLLLMDIDVSGIGGLELIRCLRILPQTLGLPIVVLTSRAMPRERTLCLAAGANEFFAKPCRVSVLLPVIRRLLTD